MRTEAINSGFQYDYDTRMIRWINDRGELEEWEYAGDNYVWSAQELKETLERNYFKYKGIPLFETIISEWGKKSEERPIYKDDIMLSMVNYLGDLESEYMKMKYPDILRELEDLKKRVQLLERQRLPETNEE